jgi:hypothetical protein
VIVIAYLGNVTLGIHFAGVREATLGTTSPVLAYKDLVAAGAQLVESMRMPRWRRWLRKLYRRLRRSN